MSQRHNICHILASLNGASFMGIDFETVPKLSGGKANTFMGRVTKRTEGASVMVFANKYVNGYEAMVRRRLTQEGKDADNFVLGPRTWGTRIDGMPLVEHKGEIYLDAIFMKSGESTYLVDGTLTPAASITGLTESTASGEQGGLDNKVIIRTISLGNVKSIRAGGQTYTGEFYYDPNEALVPVADDTTHLLASATNASRLHDSIRQIQSGGAVQHDLIVVSDVDEVLDMIGDVTTKLQSGGKLTHDDIANLSKLASDLNAYALDWLTQQI